MATFNVTTKGEFRSRDQDQDENTERTVRLEKTVNEYYRTRITLAASTSAQVHSMTPTSGVGHLIIYPSRDIDLQINGTGAQFGLCASSEFKLITQGSGGNTTEITSVSLWNNDTTNKADVDIIETD